MLLRAEVHLGLTKSIYRFNHSGIESLWNSYTIPTWLTMTQLNLNCTKLAYIAFALRESQHNLRITTRIAKIFVARMTPQGLIVNP